MIDLKELRATAQRIANMTGKRRFIFSNDVETWEVGEQAAREIWPDRQPIEIVEPEPPPPIGNPG